MKLLWIVAATILCSACFAQQAGVPQDYAERERLVQNLLEQVTRPATPPPKVMTVYQFNSTSPSTTPVSPVVIASNSTEANFTTEAESPVIPHRKGCRGRFSGEQTNQTENGEMNQRHPHRREDFEGENSQNPRSSRGFEGRPERRHERDHGREGRPHNQEGGHPHHRGQVNQSGSEETVPSQDSQGLLSQPDQSNFSSSQPSGNDYYPHGNPKKQHSKVSKGVRIGVFIFVSFVGIFVLYKLVRVCKRRRLARKQRKEAMIQAALQLQTQQSLINNSNNNNGSVSIGHPLLPNQPISLGHPYNPYQQQIIYVPYPVPQQDQQQQHRNVVQGEQIGEPIPSAPQQQQLQQQQQYLPHAITAPHQNFMQIQIPQVQPIQFAQQRQETITDNSNNNQVRYPVLAPLNIGGVQQVPFQYGYPQQYSQQ